MKDNLRKIMTCVVLSIHLLFTVKSQAQTVLVKNLAAGRLQTLVVYGTSLSAGPGGQAWVDSVETALNNRYQHHLKVYNSGKSGMWSTWGVQHLEDSVISKKPDAVLMEFSMNDALLDYQTSVQLSMLNLNFMIDRIKLYNPNCEVILQIMNIPVNQHGEKRPHLNEYYQAYRKIARKRKLLLIDHYPHWKKILDDGKSEYLSYVPDGLHPDEKSARKIIAPFVLKKLFYK